MEQFMTALLYLYPPVVKWACASRNAESTEFQQQLRVLGLHTFPQLVPDDTLTQTYWSEIPPGAYPAVPRTTLTHISVVAFLAYIRKTTALERCITLSGEINWCSLPPQLVHEITDTCYTQQLTRVVL